LYEETGGDEHAMVGMIDIGQRLGFDQSYTSRIVDYLAGEGLVDYRALGGLIGITHYGVVEAEESLLRGGPSLNQSTPGATTIRPSVRVKVDRERLIHSLGLIKAELPTLQLSHADMTDLLADVRTVEAQLGSSQPNDFIVREALIPVRYVLAGAGRTHLSDDLRQIIDGLD
jgi:hypothetical protein